jgi:hypothetical protein
MNQGQKTRFKQYVATNSNRLLNSDLKTGEGRGSDAKENNYKIIVGILQELGLNTTKGDVEEGASLVKQATGRHVEVKEPARDNGAAGKLTTLENGSSDVQEVINHINVRLDNDQLKHQHPHVPIGTRKKGGGNRFVQDCDAAWHRATTMQHMANWAGGLLGITEGQTMFHGQLIPVDDIHYEGFCLLAGGVKYVLFHCYPSDRSPLLLKRD